MNKSESISAIAPALVKAQAEIKGALKDSTNPHFRSKYADLSSVVEAVKAPLLKQGIAFLQGVHDAENGVAVETVLLHTSGEWISSTLRIPASKQDAQGYGSAITYGRRYGLQAMCGVPAEDDDGNAATASAPPSTSRITPVAGSLAGLEPDEQTKAKEIANGIVDLWNEGKEIAAYELFYENNLSNEMKLGIWEVLQPHSKIRNTLKKMHNDPTTKKAA
jgi:hypothetical protein